jgi:DNA mismatch repair protein MutS2
MISNNVLDKLEYPKVLQFIAKYSITENGKKLLAGLTPYSQHEEAIQEGLLVSQAKEILIKNNPPPIDYLPDLNESLSQSNIEGAALESKKILDILKLAVISRNLFQYLKSNAEAAPELSSQNTELFVDKIFEHHITKIIDENGEVKDNASQKLSEIRKDIARRKDDLIKTVNKIVKYLNEQDIVREDYLTLRDGRIVIPVKAEHKRHIKGFIHSESSTGQTVYIEPAETLELNNEIISLSFAEKREIERLLRELTKKIASESIALKISLKKIAHLDSIFSKAKFSIEIVGAYPETDPNKVFRLNDARHPILQKKVGKNSTIPLNAEVGKNKIILITGPNAGGKTVVLKTIGLLACMVNSGIHIPTSPDSNFHLFDDILLDIGDQQSIEDDLSTFSSHLTNIKNIMESAGENSLILLDEIGTGTDPTEGSALAAAVLIKLLEKKATVFATTHHGSLKLIANEVEGFENAAMEFDHKNLKPTYVFKQGIPGSSYAFEIAGRIGLSENFLEIAKSYLDTDKHTVENFLVDIEAKSFMLEDKLKKMEIENTRLKGLSNLYTHNMDKLNKEKKEILKQAKLEADKYLKDINKKIENIVKEIKEAGAGKDAMVSAKKSMQNMKENNQNLFREEVDLIEEKYDFIPGDYAIIKNTTTSGKISEVFKEKNKAALDVRGLKMMVSLDDLLPAKKEKIKEEPDRLYASNFMEAKMRIDIRGEKPESAEFEIIKFIDNAYSSSIERVEILHGKGTGALKKIVKEILKNHDKVKNFYFAPVEFGGEGITIAELK